MTTNLHNLLRFPTQIIPNSNSEILLRIPDFQRGYSWEDKQLEELFEDINRITDNAKYFI